MVRQYRYSVHGKGTIAWIVYHSILSIVEELKSASTLCGQVIELENMNAY